MTAANVTDEQWLKLLAIVKDDDPRYSIAFPIERGESVRVIEYTKPVIGYVIEWDGTVTKVEADE